MNFHNTLHPYYCGIDLHARSLYACIINQAGETVFHKEVPADPDALRYALEPYIGNLVVGVECMHCWYWVADFREDLGIDFILGHALYMKAIHGGKARNVRIDSYKIAKPEFLYESIDLPFNSNFAPSQYSQKGLEPY